MTDRFTAYMVSLQNRDTTLVMLAGISAAVVVAWCLVDYLPWPEVRTRLKNLFIVGGIPLWIVTLFSGFMV